MTQTSKHRPAINPSLFEDGSSSTVISMTVDVNTNIPTAIFTAGTTTETNALTQANGG